MPNRVKAYLFSRVAAEIARQLEHGGHDPEQSAKLGHGKTRRELSINSCRHLKPLIPKPLNPQTP